MTPPQIASVTGQQVSALGQDPTVSQILANGGVPGSATGSQPTSVPMQPGGQSPTVGTDVGYGLGPSSQTSTNDSWIPVDPSSGAASSAGTSAGGQPISVTTTHDGVTTTVQVPAGQASDISVGYTVDGQQFNENIDVSAGGKVSVD